MEGKNVLQLVESALPDQPSVPIYDLSGDRVCIALLIKRDDFKLDFYCHLKPVKTDRMIRLLNERDGYLVAVTGKDSGSDIESGPVEVDRAFFDEHCIAVMYQTQQLTPEQLLKLDVRNNIRVNVVTRGLLTIGKKHARAIGEASIVPTLDELLSETPSVEQHIELCDDKNVEHELIIRHNFKAPSMKQSTEYQRTQKTRFKEGGVRKIIVKHKEICRLYDELIDSCDNVTGDHAAIVDRMPYVWKMDAVQTLFRDAERKNV